MCLVYWYTCWNLMVVSRLHRIRVYYSVSRFSFQLYSNSQNKPLKGKITLTKRKHKISSLKRKTADVSQSPMLNQSANPRSDIIPPVSPMLPTEGLSVDDLDPSSPAGLWATGAPLLSLGWEKSCSWAWSSESSFCCGGGSCWGAGMWKLAGCPLHRLATCGWKSRNVF